jgi:hypothetical protein
MFLRTWRACVPTSLPASSPVLGSIPATPPIVMNVPTLAMWLYGPIGVGTFLGVNRYDIRY